MRTEVVTKCDLRRAHHVTGRCPGSVLEMTNRFIGERLCRSEESRGVDNNTSHAGAESDHAWAVKSRDGDELFTKQLLCQLSYVGTLAATPCGAAPRKYSMLPVPSATATGRVLPYPGNNSSHPEDRWTSTKSTVSTTSATVS